MKYQEEEYRDILKSLQLLTGLRMALYDTQYHIVWGFPDGPCRFCRLLRLDSHANQQCLKTDIKAFERCRRDRKLYSYFCPIGLFEIVKPLYSKGILCGYIMLGQGIENTPEARKRVSDAAREYISEAEIAQALDSASVLSAAEMAAITKTVDIVTEYISTNNMIPILDAGLAECTHRYISERINKKIRISDMCMQFHCSNKTLTESFRRAYGITIVQYTNEIRLTRARDMLRTYKTMPISEIAAECGIPDQGYFSKMFARRFGQSPSDFRKQL